MAEGWLFTWHYLLILFVVTTNFFPGTGADLDPCLRGFTQTIPPVEKWNNYTVLDVNGGSFLYPELMFTCNGILNSLTIPYSTIQGTKWDNDLTLTLSVWRRRNERAINIELGVLADTITSSGDTTAKVQGNATLNTMSSNMILEFDIIRITVPRYSGGMKREHIPVLLTEHQLGDGGRTVLLPLIQVDFTPELKDIPATTTTVMLMPSTTSSNVMSTTCPTTPSQSAGQCNTDNGATAALGALLGILLLVVVGLLVVIGILSIKIWRKDHKHTDSTKIEKMGMSTCQSPSLLHNTQAEMPVYEVASNSVTDTKANDSLYNTVDSDSVKLFPTEFEKFKVSVPAAYEFSPYWKPGHTVDVIYEQIEQYTKIPPSAINKQQQLGEGEFGVVYKGHWKSTTGRTQTVALKTLKSTASNDERVKLLQEAAIMGQFTHPHIVTLYGVVKEVNKPMLVMEFLQEGDLREYLLKLNDDERSKKAQLLSTLLRFCQEIADGMRYLSQKGFIHRDLAARNVLLTADIKCKIADFGMSRDLEEDYYYKPKGGRIPVKWTAPEAIFYKRYTTKSDVWSYGMIMYEIWSLGHKPLEDYPVDEVIKMLHSKKIQPPPPGCPREIYALMVQCWEPDPKKRITFDNMFGKLSSGSGMILKWKDEDNTSSPLCSVLGAPLEHGQELYKDLQNLYLTKV